MEREALLSQVDARLAECHRLTRGWRSVMPWNLYRTFRLFTECDRDHARVRELLK